jgi:hypothetical protein
LELVGPIGLEVRERNAEAIVTPGPVALWLGKVRCEPEGGRLFNAADFDCSTYGFFRICLGVRLRLILLFAMVTASIRRGKSMIWIAIEVYRSLRRYLGRLKD